MTEEQIEIKELRKKLNKALSELDNLKKSSPIDTGSEIVDITTETAYEALGSLAKILTDIVSKVKDFRTVRRNSKKIIVESILKFDEIIPVSKAVKIFGISRSTFNTWVTDLNLKCGNSYFEKCNKRYPHQITPHEVLSIIKALTLQETKHWSMRNVHLYGLRKGTLTVSESTMYEINKRLGIRKRVNNKQYKKKKEGIRAIAPNQIWHMDVTIIKTMDGKRYYIYLVLDNFSRYILAYRISHKISGLMASELLQEAYRKASTFGKELNIDLIVDGGVENNNRYVEDFIRGSNINMKKLVALKDINFSNSMIEYMNKILKYSYLFPRNIRDLKHLKGILKYSIKDFCERRPHGQLDGLTPLEAISGIALPPNFKSLIYRDSRNERLKFSRTNLCQKCIDPNKSAQSCATGMTDLKTHFTSPLPTPTNDFSIPLKLFPLY